MVGLYVVWYEKNKLVRKSATKRRQIYSMGIHDSMNSSISLFKYGMLYSSYSPKLVLGCHNWFEKGNNCILTSYISLPQLEIHFIIVLLVLFIVLNEYGNHIAELMAQIPKGAGLQRLDTMTLVVCLFTAWSVCSCFISLLQARQYAVLPVDVDCAKINVYAVYCASLFRRKVYNLVLQRCLNKSNPTEKRISWRRR